MSDNTETMMNYSGYFQGACLDRPMTENECLLEMVDNAIDSIIKRKENKDKFEHCKPETKEAYYYRKIFCEKFGDHNSGVIPKFWLPNWSDGLKEPSARELNVYK